MAEPTAPISRAERRANSRRNRIRIGIAAALALVIVAVLGFVVFSGGSDTEPKKVAAAPAPSTTTVPPTAPPTTTTTTPPHATAATTKGGPIQVYDLPNGAVQTTLSARTDYLQPRTFLVVEKSPDWLKVLLPMRPNNSTGWIRAGDVNLSDVPFEIRVSLDEHMLRMFKDGQEVLSSPVVIGAPNTPTPLGTFYITDPVDLKASPNGAYGAYALGLSGYSEVLMSFNGGPGQIAVHGTNNPSQVGQNISNGCVRVPNDIIVQIADQAPLGTPVIIS
jgi:lipoprotein-anchoring transpeptidase ErfK/SrfK